MTQPYQAPGARRAAPLADVDEDQDVTSFPGAVGWTIAGTILPGLGLLRAKRWFDGIMTLVFFGFVLVCAGYLAYEQSFTRALLTSPLTLTGIAIMCGILALFVVGIILATYSALRPHVVTSGQRVAGALIVLVLVFIVCTPLAIGAGYSLGHAGIIR